jgi:hypothetical protein
VCESKPVSDVANSKMYAKSDFYERPLVEAAKCTHLIAYNNDAKKVQTCKDQDADEATCLLNGNFYTEGADDKICGGTGARVQTATFDVTGVAGSGNAAAITNGKNACTAQCTTVGTDCDVA